MLDDHKLDVIDGELYYFKNFISQNDCEKLYQYFLNSIPWTKDTITVFGNTYDIPRKQAYFADAGMNYSYSGKKMNLLKWDPTLLEIKNKIENKLEVSFNACLMNLYETGEDSNGWHADNEKELGTNPTIASVSLGEERVFQIKHQATKSRKDLTLENGSLLHMAGEFQHHWKHCLPKRKNINKARINLTFRKIINT